MIEEEATMEPTMSKEEYVRRFAKVQKMSIEDVQKHFVVVECDCESVNCNGWSAVNVSEVVVIGIEKARHYILTLRKVLSKRPESISMVDRAILSDMLQQMEAQASPHEPVTMRAIDAEIAKGVAK